MLASFVEKLTFILAGCTLEDGPSSSSESKRSNTKAEAQQSERLPWIVKGVCRVHTTRLFLDIKVRSVKRLTDCRRVCSGSCAGNDLCLHFGIFSHESYTIFLRHPTQQALVGG